MTLIATHNSATSCHSARWYHRLLVPFARCQTKSIGEQVTAGGTWLDIRVRRDGDKLVAAHGLWRGMNTLNHILREASNATNTIVWVQVTWEGALPDDEARKKFVQSVRNTAAWHKNIVLFAISEKKGWRTLWLGKQQPPAMVKAFDEIAVGWKSLRWLIPVPRLWAKMGNNKIEYNDEVYTMVDFI